MTSHLFPVRLAGAGSGDSRTSGHLDQPPLWRLTAGRNWRDKCVSPGRTCPSGSAIRPGQAANTTSGLAARLLGVKLPGNQLSLITLSCAALVTPSSLVLGLTQ